MPIVFLVSKTGVDFHVEDTVHVASIPSHSDAAAGHWIPCLPDQYTDYVICDAMMPPSGTQLFNTLESLMFINIYIFQDFRKILINGIIWLKGKMITLFQGPMLTQPTTMALYRTLQV